MDSVSAAAAERILFVGEDAQRFHRLVVAVQRLAHPHQHDAERGVAHVECVDEDAHLTGDLAGGQISDESHLPSEAERAGHRAADLRGHAEGHRRCVRDEHRLDGAAVGETEKKFLSAVDRGLALDYLRRGNRETGGERRTQIARKIRHRRGIGDAAAIDPAKNLTGVKALVPALFERRLERRAFQFGEVESARRGRHGISRFPRYEAQW